MNFNYYQNKSKGITLIALVITIIVLLILAGVTIAMLIGDNGILNKASSSKSEWNQGSEEEQIKLAVLNSKMSNEGTNFNINKEKLDKELQNIGIPENQISKNTNKTEETDAFPWRVTGNTGKKYEITDKGEVNILDSSDGNNPEDKENNETILGDKPKEFQAESYKENLATNDGWNTSVSETTYYGGYTGSGCLEFNSEGEIYIPFKTSSNTSNSIEYCIDVNYVNGGYSRNQWVNIWEETNDTTNIVSFKGLNYKKMDSKEINNPVNSVTQKTMWSKIQLKPEKKYMIGLYSGQQYGCFDKVTITPIKSTIYEAEDYKDNLAVNSGWNTSVKETTYYGGYTGRGCLEFNSEGEVYIPFEISSNEASKEYEIEVYYANGGYSRNQWVNIWEETKDTSDIINFNSTNYKKVKSVETNDSANSVISKTISDNQTLTPDKKYMIGLYSGQQYGCFDKVIIRNKN